MALGSGLINLFYSNLKHSFSSSFELWDLGSPCVERPLHLIFFPQSEGSGSLELHQDSPDSWASGVNRSGM